MKKPMARSDSASEAKRRPKQPPKFACKNLDSLLSMNQNGFNYAIDPEQSPPPMSAAGLLGPDLVALNLRDPFNATPEIHIFATLPSYF